MSLRSFVAANIILVGVLVESSVISVLVAGKGEIISEYSKSMQVLVAFIAISVAAVSLITYFFWLFIPDASILTKDKS